MITYQKVLRGRYWSPANMFRWIPSYSIVEIHVREELTKVLKANKLPSRLGRAGAAARASSASSEKARRARRRRFVRVLREEGGRAAWDGGGGRVRVRQAVSSAGGIGAFTRGGARVSPRPGVGRAARRGGGGGLLIRPSGPGAAAE